LGSWVSSPAAWPRGGGSAALAALHEFSQGALREIDRLANAALRDAVRRKKKLVDRELVLHAGDALVRFD
jgi:hypothetical protein